MDAKTEQMLKLREQFMAQRDCWDYLQAITAFMQWAKLTGNYPAVSSAQRFMKFLQGDHDEN